MSLAQSRNGKHPAAQTILVIPRGALRLRAE